MATASDWSLQELRRNLHQYPETGWEEFRTTALVAEELDERGYKVHLGEDAVSVEKRLGVPEDDKIQRARERARDEDTPVEYLEEMGSVTGLVAEKQFGDTTHPVVGVRVDIDALPITESNDTEHRPAQEDFASRHPNEMHTCGHDGHTSIGVGIARELDLHANFTGTGKYSSNPLKRAVEEVCQ